jgi:hypothetical protein
VGSSRWHTSASMVCHCINETISILLEGLPSNITIVWKSSGWCNNCPWTPDENKRGHDGDNYKMYAANQEVENIAASINARNLLFLDWGRKVLPRSLGMDRLISNDGNPYHYGLIPRLQLLQMLAIQLDDEILAGGTKVVQSDILVVSLELPFLSIPAGPVLMMVLLFCHKWPSKMTLQQVSFTSCTC